jgi:hypothetical protein
MRARVLRFLIMVVGWLSMIRGAPLLALLKIVALSLL